jgi:hypothetical protein
MLDANAMSRPHIAGSRGHDGRPGASGQPGYTARAFPA